MIMARQVCDAEKSRDMVVVVANSSSSSGGFCYPAATTIQPHQHVVNQIQQAGFVTDPEMFNLTTGMEMIGFSKNLHITNNNASAMCKSLFEKSSSTGQHPDEAAAAGRSSSKTINNDSNFYHHHHHQYNNDKQQADFTTSGISETTSSENLIVVGAPHHDSSSSATWQQDQSRLLVDDSSFRCVFPCEGNERPSQGLSLSLTSNNPSTIGLQSFELRQNSHHQQQHQMLQDQGYLSQPNKAAANNLYQGHFLFKNSKFLVPAQELLNEFCSLGTARQSEVVINQKNRQQREENNDGGDGGSSNKHPLSSLEFVELQKRKTKLLAMLEEVDRRYKHYCNQMRAVVSSFEAVAGNDAATVYSALALKAMSRHFRCLKDGILDQLQSTRKSMGEKDPASAGTTRGETPRLRVIDQALRQQRAFQQMSMMETHPWRPQRGLPERSVSVLRAWLFEHFLHPYPSDVDKHILARQTGLSRSQVSNWFINARVRLWKPMVEEMYLEEEKENESSNMVISSDGGTTTDDVHQNHPPNSTIRLLEDHKPTQQARLLSRIADSECVSSIINNNPTTDDPIKSTKTIHNMNPSHDHQQFLGRVAEEAFGSVEIDFSSSNAHHSTAGGMVSYSTNTASNHQHGGFNNAGAVSLTLGLQQHGDNGVSLAFPPATHQGSMFYSREQIEECQPVVQYSLLDGEGQSMPYMNLMGTQLLHDLAN